MSSFLGQPLGQFLDRLAASEPTPGGGGVAALSVAMAAGLVAMAARFSARQLSAAEEVAASADRLRDRATALMERDAVAYQSVLAAFRIPREARARRDAEVREALRGAAVVPLEIAAVAAEVAEMAAYVGMEGNPNLRGDAITAVLLTEAAARSAAHLVNINVTMGGLEESLSARAADSVAATHSLAERLQGAETGQR